MIWLWILGILIVLAVLVARTRVGIRVRFGEAPVSAVLTLGPFRIPLTGEEKKEPKQLPKKTKEKGKKPKTPQKKKEKSLFPKVTAADVKEAARTLGPPLKKALGRTRRSVRIDPMTVSVTIGAAADLAAGAEVYGWVSGALFNVMPALEELVRVPDPRIHIGLDFDSADTRAQGDVGVSLRIGTLIAVVFGVGIPALQWLSDLKKKQRTAPPPEAARKADRTHAA